MSELNSQITRLKITYLAKLPLFISLKSLCRYSSKAVSLLMPRTQEMGNRRTTHNVVRIKASDLLSRVPRFPLHSFSQGWCVGEKGGLASPLPVQNMWWSFLVSWRFLEESGGQPMLYLPLPFVPFIIVQHDLALSSDATIVYPCSCLRFTLGGYFKPPVVYLQFVLQLLSFLPVIRSGASLKFPSARCQMNASDRSVCWINWEGSICWLQTNSKTHLL